MDFTREPIIETVITPKEGCKLVVRSSKSTGQEEYFVDAVEMVAFGNSFFFRSQERPKAFLVPVTDYEILEVREARMILKNVGMDRSIKIAGGREPAKPPKETIVQEKVEVSVPAEKDVTATTAEGNAAEVLVDGRVDKKRDRRRHYKRRRGREDEPIKDGQTSENGVEGEGDATAIPMQTNSDSEASTMPMVTSSSVISSLLPPPTMLISETIARYKDNALFKGAFFVKDEDKKSEPSEENQDEENNDSESFDDNKNQNIPIENGVEENGAEEQEIHRLRNAPAPYEAEGYLHGTLSYDEDVSDAEAEGMPAGPLPEVNEPSLPELAQQEENSTSLDLNKE